MLGVVGSVGCFRCLLLAVCLRDSRVRGGRERREERAEARWVRASGESKEKRAPSREEREEREESREKESRAPCEEGGAKEAKERSRRVDT
eukprot:1437179-Rhodomonas_salina.6